MPVDCIGVYHICKALVEEKVVETVLWVWYMVSPRWHLNFRSWFVHIAAY